MLPVISSSVQPRHGSAEARAITPPRVHGCRCQVELTLLNRVDVSADQGLDVAVARTVVVELEDLTVPVGQLLTTLEGVAPRKT